MADGTRKRRRPTSDISCSEPTESQKRRGGSSSPSHMSVKSNRSIGPPPNFSTEQPETSQKRRGGSSSPSHISVKSNRSIGPPPNFSTEQPETQTTGGEPRCSGCEEHLRDPVQLSCGHCSCKQCLSSDGDPSDSPAASACRKCGKTLRIDPEHQRDHTEDDLVWEAKKKHKEEMKEKFMYVSEGDAENQSQLNTIYTKLYMTTGEREGPQAEHEFTALERKIKSETSPQKSVNLSNIFKRLSGQQKARRLVLTKGYAGIGKSFSVQKFILDWAEEKENQDVDFVFLLSFREMNLCTDTKSLNQLFVDFNPALGILNGSEDYAKTKVIVILDGLDESRLELDFSSTKRVTSLSEATSLKNLLTNLIRGHLLPNADLWITSRAVASNAVPAEVVDMVTEIRGFNQPQKEEYFKKRFCHDPGLAKRIISHIQSTLSVDIMCQIPIFCWISAMLFQEVFREDEKVETPQTLTEMMAYFLFIQTKRRSRKSVKKPEEKKKSLLETEREFLLKLGKLAFDHLQDNSLVFYEEDLEVCGIKLEEAPVYSGFFTTVLRKEDIFSGKKVFFFAHLTIQEFFAAVYVYDCFTNNNTAGLGNFLNLKDKEHTLLDLLKMTVEKVLEKNNNHLTYFLRFLLGLIVESNRRVLQGLLRPPDPSQEIDKKILTYLKSIRRKAISPDQCICLFRAMDEMRDQIVKQEIEEYLKQKDRPKTELTPLHCSALAYLLQVSKDKLEILDLKSYNTSDEGRRRLIPAVKSSKKAVLADCKVTTEWVQHLAYGLKFPNTPLQELDLSNNDLEDSGVEMLCEGLSSQNCSLEILRLSGCLVTEVGCTFLASALKANPSSLRKLDLSYNPLGDSGVKLLSELKDDPEYKLNDLDVGNCGELRMRAGFKKYACELTLDPNTAHRNLRLSEGNRKVTWVNEEQSYLDHPERFEPWPQVLCEQGLDGRCYWEVDVLNSFSVGVTYRSIARKGDVNECKLGHNKESWSLLCSNDGCFALHKDDSTAVSLRSRSSRIGVYLDWPAGVLSFYRVSSDSLTRLHTFKEKFSEPLYPAVELRSPSSAFFCQLT
ncbi:NLR family CARD domain-containing protein 3-like isoform X2 [Echeneis naucrates]|uniref:NLR family CARD domain-containing protein 3-like n=1 Tax=Echeneis naucrates TaxID=173247 RepID=A0A665TM92_ECHNA|nr:NLR family CARD domain-containing protein 3-like isoform X2 [Echeneis naucrates]